MEPKEFASFDRLLTPQYVTIIFYVGVAASVLLGLADIAAGLSAGSVSPILWGLATMIAGPVFVRVGCELLILAFKTVDWIAEINATLARQQRQIAEQAERDEQSQQQRDGRTDGSNDTTGSPLSGSRSGSATGEPQLPSRSP